MNGTSVAAPLAAGLDIRETVLGHPTLALHAPPDARARLGEWVLLER